jgi:acyl dehydratase
MMQVNELVFDVEVPGSSLETIAWFSQATEDPNPIHVDPEFALECGFPQVIQQGPMTTAHLARLLAQYFGAQSLKSIDVSFLAPVFPLEVLRLQARVSAVSQNELTIDLSAVKKDGTITAKGQAKAVISA